jgi:hypothetical protein
MGARLPRPPSVAWDPWDEPAFPEPRRWPRRGLSASRRRAAAIVGAALLALIVGLVVVEVPFAQSVQGSFTISDPGNPGVLYGTNKTFPYAGTFSFSWHTSTISGVNFTVVDPQGRYVYTTVNDTGHGSISVDGGVPYLFEVYTPVPETVTVTGTFSFTAPLL